MTRAIYWHLSAYYFTYCAVLGIIFPFWGLYLESQQVSAYHIGVVSAAFLGSNIIAANFWGWLADKYRNRLFLVKLGNLVPVLCFAFIPFVDHVGLLVILIFVGSFCWQGLVPQMEVIAVEQSKSNKGGYARARLWGSVGFVAASLLLGELIEIYGLTIVPYSATLMFCLIWIVVFKTTLLISESESKCTSKVRANFRLPVKPIIGMLLVCFFLHFSHGAYYTFFSLYLEKFGYTSRSISLVWAVAIGAEILMFFAFKHVLTYLNFYQLLLICLIMTLIRWLLTAIYPQSMPVLLIAQVFHAFSFAGFHVCALEYIRIIFGEEFHGRGQALYGSICVAGGAALGSFISGLMWKSDVELVFVVSAFSAFLALSFAVTMVRSPNER